MLGCMECPGVVIGMVAVAFGYEESSPTMDWSVVTPWGHFLRQLTNCA